MTAPTTQISCVYPFGATFPACQSRVFWPTLARGMLSTSEKPSLAIGGRALYRAGAPRRRVFRPRLRSQLSH